MDKSRNFSIYLLKNNYSANNALKEEHALGEPVTDASFLPKGATLYVMDTRPNPPWWRAYWGISQDLIQTLKGAIVFLPVDDYCFALTFGHTYHNLKEVCYEYDFGLRITLNALDSQKIKSTDILLPEKAKKERIQSPIASDLTFFDINKDETIIKKLTGAVKEEYKNILSNVTGASNLRISSKVQAGGMSELCSTLLEIYSKDDYKSSFPDIQNILPVKDPSLSNQLNEKLIEAFNANSIELVLTIPEIIDYSNSFQINYSGAGKSKENHDDVYIADYREYIENHNVKEINLKVFKCHKLNIEDENGNKKQSFSIYKCLLFDCELNSEHYHLCEGEWYQIDKDYIQKLRNNLNPYFSDHDILRECNEKREDDFNQSIARDNPQFICLDKKNIAPTKQTAVEPCDLFTVKNNVAYLIHIKISTKSAYLSHLFNQGLNSVELLRLQEESKQKIKKLITNKEYHSSIENDRFGVVYGIITAKDKNKKSDNLPIFSRISLMRTMNSLKVMGIQGSVVFIKDNINRKLNKRTTAKKSND